MLSKRNPTGAVSTPRISAVAAGYMELEGARKDGDCQIVEVQNGISKDLGCCNLYKPVKGADKFNCGHCGYVTGGGKA